MTNTQRVTFPSPSGEASGILVTPDTTGGKPPGVVVIQEWWGLNEQIQAAAARFAAAGFAAVVPDLYHGKLAKDADEAGKLMNALDFGKAVQEIAGAVDFIRERSSGKVAVTGYCLGGALSFAAAVNIRGLAAVVPFYGLPGDLDWTKIDAPVQAHFATHDEWATVAGAQKIKNAVKAPMELHVYDAQHAFCNERRPEVYNAEACKQAWDRTLAFLRAHTA
ncbi:MAG: dienelactone hydrolase family protein [Deltaproteobacteria bacterium]|nr:MAG: dienelactone hydrolase family protein [Deltaproteobacteria bacterium]TMQ19744.1 MAG: dienelactone hydrolase family protein [Deltaproteobacteria bacterium]